MRTIETIKNEIERYENASWDLTMKDHWTSEDYRKDDFYTQKLRELRAELKAVA